MPRDISIVIADDHPIFREGLIATIQRSGSMKVVGQAGDGQAALELVGTHEPDVLILDIDMPLLDGVETARKLKALQSKTSPIFLTMHKDILLLRSLRTLGVRGYLLKDSALSEVVKCIESVHHGDMYLSPALSDLIFDEANDTDSGFSPRIEGLTATEKKVLGLIAESKTTRQIAEELFVSVRTIETHRYNICTKLKLNGAHALFKFALENRNKILTSLPD